ncbi:MAG: dienelactone hydrolase family protein [Planctomycetota bacterium]|jgi:hypothetical protein
MRSFEVLLIVANLLALLWPLMSGRVRRQWLVFVSGACFLLLFAHLAWEGYRWQMIPAYLCTVVLFIGGQLRFWWFKPLPKARRRWALAVVGSSLGLLLLCLATLAASLVPVFDFPGHTGVFQVGRRSIAALPGADPSLQLWYPTQADPGEGSSYALELDRPGTAFPGLSPEFFAHLSLLRSPAIEGAPLAVPESGRLPLVVFIQHRPVPLGWSSYLCEDLASHGFVVLGMDAHPEYGMGSTLVDAAMQELRAQPEAKNLMLDRFALIGQGLGSSAASQALQASGVQAALYLAPQGTIAPSRGKPCMVMAGAGLDTELPEDISYRLKLIEFEPFDFTDLALYTELEIDGLHGSVAGERCLQIVAAYARAFCRAELLSEAAPLLAGASEEYPEVSFSDG